MNWAKTMYVKTIFRYLSLILFGYSLGILGSLVDLSAQRNRSLEFIAANPSSESLQPIHGSPSEIETKLRETLNSVPALGTAPSQEKRNATVHMRDAFFWLKDDANERMRSVRITFYRYLFLSLLLLSMSYSLKIKPDQRPEPIPGTVIPHPSP